jgi:hypothetical protein
MEIKEFPDKCKQGEETLFWGGCKQKTSSEG